MTQKILNERKNSEKIFTKQKIKHFNLCQFLSDVNQKHDKIMKSNILIILILNLHDLYEAFLALI